MLQNGILGRTFFRNVLLVIWGKGGSMNKLFSIFICLCFLVNTSVVSSATAFDKTVKDAAIYLAQSYYDNFVSVKTTSAPIIAKAKKAVDDAKNGNIGISLPSQTILQKCTKEQKKNYDTVLLAYQNALIKHVKDLQSIADLKNKQNNTQALLLANETSKKSLIDLSSAGVTLDELIETLPK